MAKIKIKNTETITEAFEKFLLSKRAQGIADKTAATYSQHFHAIGKHLDTNKDSSCSICWIKAGLSYTNRTYEHSADPYTRYLKYGHWLLFLLFLYRQTEGSDGGCLWIFRAMVGSIVLGCVPKRNDIVIADYRCCAYYWRNYV